MPRLPTSGRPRSASSYTCRTGKSSKPQPASPIPRSCLPKFATNGSRRHRSGGSNTGSRGARRGALPHPTMDQELDAVLSAYDAKRLVIAHTPILSGIAITGNGRLARIDTGISRYYGGALSWLEIIGDQMIPHIVGRPAS